MDATAPSPVKIQLLRLLALARPLPCAEALESSPSSSQRPLKIGPQCHLSMILRLHLQPLQHIPSSVSPSHGLPVVPKLNTFLPHTNPLHKTKPVCKLLPLLLRHQVVNLPAASQCSVSRSCFPLVHRLPLQLKKQKTIATLPISLSPKCRKSPPPPPQSFALSPAHLPSLLAPATRVRRLLRAHTIKFPCDWSQAAAALTARQTLIPSMRSLTPTKT